jgi:hypothetical protein
MLADETDDTDKKQEFNARQYIAENKKVDHRCWQMKLMTQIKSRNLMHYNISQRIRRLITDVGR